VALDQSFIGRTYPPASPYEVGAEKIREFADAIGDPNPVYRDADAARAAGHPDVIAPSHKSNDAAWRGQNNRPAATCPKPRSACS